MTAYSKASVLCPFGRLILEIQSVNRKFLEINLSLPLELNAFDPLLRNLLKKRIFCGQINVTLKSFFENESPVTVSANLPLVKEVYSAYQQIAQTLGLDSSEISLNLFSHIPDIFLFQRIEHSESKYSEIIEELALKALDDFILMREREGEVLKQDFLKRIEIIQKLTEQIQEKAKHIPLRYREKLLQRIKDIVPDSIENEERILREVLFFAEKMDVQEELTRIYSHVSQFKQLLAGKEEGVGKNLDFLTQELSREINTLSAKIQDVECSKLALEMKLELSRIREQVQNVE